MRRAFLFLTFAALVACGGEAPPRTVSASLVDRLAVPPGAVRVTAAQGPQAAVAEYRAATQADSIATWYRRWFLSRAWRIIGDTRDPDGTIVLHADSAGRPFWLMIRAAPHGAEFAVMAAEPDSSR